MLELSESEKLYVRIFERLGKPSSEFYRGKYPQTFTQLNYGFSILLPLQFVYQHYGSDYPKIMRLVNGDGLYSIVAIDSRESGRLPVAILEKLTDEQVSILENFSQIIEKEWLSQEQSKN